MNPPSSKAQIPPSPRQSCPFIRAQTNNISRTEELEASTRYCEKTQLQHRQQIQAADPMTKFMYALKAKELNLLPRLIMQQDEFIDVRCNI